MSKTLKEETKFPLVITYNQGIAMNLAIFVFQRYGKSVVPIYDEVMPLLEEYQQILLAALPPPAQQPQ